MSVERPAMSRPAKGTVEVKTLADGTRVFKLRFFVRGRREHEVLHERRHCKCGCGGSWNERTAAVELENVLARVRAGVWRKRNPPPPVAASRVPTFHEYASAWLQAKIDGSSVTGRSAQTRRPITARAWRTICCRSSANTSSTKSTATCVSPSRRTSSQRPRSSGEPSPPARFCATAAGGKCEHSGPP
jgi:hypothetical protein